MRIQNFGWKTVFRKYANKYTRKYIYEYIVVIIFTVIEHTGTGLGKLISVFVNDLKCPWSFNTPQNKPKTV